MSECLKCGSNVCGFLGCETYDREFIDEEIARMKTEEVMEDITDDANLCIIRDALMKYYR